MDSSSVGSSVLAVHPPGHWMDKGENNAQFGPHGNHTPSDLGKPHLGHSFDEDYAPVFIFYGFITVFGTLFNVLEIYAVVGNKLYKERTYAYFLNLAATDILKCLVVIPFSQFPVLVQNWILGEFFCYFLPMLQDIPAHVTIITMIMLVFERWIYLHNPSKRRIPASVFCSAAWFMAVCITMPYPIYASYVNLTDHSPPANETGICLHNAKGNLSIYTFGVVFGFFLLPLSGIVCLFWRIADMLEEEDRPIMVDGHEIMLRASFRRSYNFRRGILRNRNDGSDENEQNETVDAKIEEKRVLKFMIAIIAVYVACFGPLNILSKVVQLLVKETYGSSHVWDKIYAVVVWMAFLPTITNPILVLALAMREEDKRILSAWCGGRWGFGGGGGGVPNNDAIPLQDFDASLFPSTSRGNRRPTGDNVGSSGCSGNDDASSTDNRPSSTTLSTNAGGDRCPSRISGISSPLLSETK